VVIVSDEAHAAARRKALDAVIPSHPASEEEPVGMGWIVGFYRSSLGKKWVMAITGLLLFGFVFVHMAGNLKVYQGPAKFNAYAEGLRTVGEPFVGRAWLLWAARLTLLAAVGLHIHAAWATSRQSWGARRQRYRQRAAVKMSYAERTMRYGGVIILLFVLYHLAHFTWGWRAVHPDFVHGDPYHNFVAGFSSWPVALIYLVAQVFLGFHLYHGVWSMFQSVGWVPRTGRDWRRPFASTFAALVVLGNVSFPLAVLTGVVREEPPPIDRRAGTTATGTAVEESP
jgi:succinate dehydrogenase / fumarate reductase cytochrome b subunit